MYRETRVEHTNSLEEKGLLLLFVCGGEHVDRNRQSYQHAPACNKHHHM